MSRSQLEKLSIADVPSGAGAFDYYNTFSVVQEGSDEASRQVLSIEQGAAPVIEDGQTITESYTVPIEFRTKNTTYETGSGDAAGNAILDGTNSLITAGSQSTKSHLKFKGLNPTGTDGDSHDIVTGDAYLSGHIDVSNGRREVVITGNIEVITASAGVTSATVAAN